MIGLDLDASRSELVCGVLELLPITAVARTPWHACGTPLLVNSRSLVIRTNQWVG